MNIEIVLLLLLMGVALLAFVREWFPIEVTALGLLAVLVVTGILDVQEALTGFSSTAVVAIGSLFVLSHALGVHSRAFVIAVCFAASAAFMTPMGYQTNLMVHAAGEYRFSDYLRFGGPLNLLVGLAALILVPLLWPF